MIIEPLCFLVSGGELAPWRANWVYRPFDHSYNTTYVPCNRKARVFCLRGVDAAMANQIARAIIANPCLQPPGLIPNWQEHYLTGAVPGDSTAAVSTIGSGGDDSSTPAPPPAARSIKKRRRAAVTRLWACMLKLFVDSRLIEHSVLVSSPSFALCRSPAGTPDHSLLVVEVSHAFMSSSKS
ncbi:hypothetical protein L917_21633 [Phytophthora nicotianae]|nr:hypothetical protein L917_21633 [Phytophthora nicotianae]